MRLLPLCRAAARPAAAVESFLHGPLWTDLVNVQASCQTNQADIGMVATIPLATGVLMETTRLGDASLPRTGRGGRVTVFSPRFQ